MTRITSLHAIVVLLLLIATLRVHAAPQTGSPAEEAPVPSQIASARKVFIANGGYESAIPPWFDGGPNRGYNQFYSAMKNWGHYQLVSTPADADLVFEILLQRASEEGHNIPRYGFRVTILDPKSHVVLWAVSQEVKGGVLSKSIESNYDKALTALVDQIKKLASGSATSAQK